MPDSMDDLFQQVLERIRGVDMRMSRTEVMESGREILTAARTYYVRTDGSDSNNGLTNTAAGAFLTLQKAYNVITSALDLSGQTVTVQIADGTYTGGLSASQPWTGGGAVTFQGNSATPANVLINITNGIAIFTSGILPGILTIKDMKLQATGSFPLGIGIRHTAEGELDYGNIDFGACAINHIRCDGPGSYIQCISSYAITGASLTHYTADLGGVIRVNSVTVTTTGTPAFGAAFATCSRSAAVQAALITFTGGATGPRYSIDSNGVIYTGLSGETYFPGNALGVVASGGQYDYDIRRIVRNSAQFDKTNTTLADITGLSLNVLAGRTYSFRAFLRTTSNVASGIKAAIAGTATATTINYEGWTQNANAIAGQTRAVALAGTVAAVTAVTVAIIIIEGSITVNAAGTLTVQFADNAGANTSSVLVNSTFEVEDITS